MKILKKFQIFNHQYLGQSSKVTISQHLFFFLADAVELQIGSHLNRELNLVKGTAVSIMLCR